MPNATLRSIVKLDTLQVKAERAATIIDSTVEVGTSVAAGTEYVFVRIPSNARIHGLSRIAGDVLDATANTPTLDLGFKAVSSNITTDDDALNDGIDLSGSAFDVRLIKDHANSGKMAWEFVSGQTSDPGGFFDLIATTKDAVTAAGGTLTLTLAYSVD
ncbi:hypothetical protein G5V65_11155 [Rhodobacter sp. HX-7-19]|uniref:Uncharacterized protein n=1 Tax=Paragemmobacter kunshanensis TaxID=2583234 RepID=A0A6M1U5A2_9RHOB|nr:hypothetical protein [Rhodobacter kunshanensis]NGQ91455.1 hypothetical protein [Rhodobacter kunshanensis]